MYVPELVATYAFEPAATRILTSPSRLPLRSRTVPNTPRLPVLKYEVGEATLNWNVGVLVAVGAGTGVLVGGRRVLVGRGRGVLVGGRGVFVGVAGGGAFVGVAVAVGVLVLVAVGRGGAVGVAVSVGVGVQVAAKPAPRRVAVGGATTPATPDWNGFSTRMPPKHTQTNTVSTMTAMVAMRHDRSERA